MPEDGRALDGTGIGRAWPLLTGERGYLDAQGIDPLPYLEMMARMTGPGASFRQLVWDGPAIPARGIEPGKPTGSTMPLVWGARGISEPAGGAALRTPARTARQRRAALSREAAGGGNVALAVHGAVRPAASRPQSPDRKRRRFPPASWLRRLAGRDPQAVRSRRGLAYPASVSMPTFF